MALEKTQICNVSLGACPRPPLMIARSAIMSALPALKNNSRKIKEPPSTESTLRACSLSSRGDHPNLEASKRGNEFATCFALVYFEVSRETWKVQVGATNRKILFQSRHGIPGISNRQFWSNGKQPWKDPI